MAEKLSHLQTLRAVAATLVIADHASSNLIKWGALPAWFQDARFELGGLGVSTFFVISGFIMIHTSFDDFGRSDRAILFALRRLIRIVPIYWLATLIGAALSMHHTPPATLSDLVRSLLFIPYESGIGGPMRPIMAQGWTLNYEMFFYALFTLALLAPRKVGLPALLAAFVLIVGGGAFVKPLSDASEANSVVTFLTAPLILLFAIGIAIGIAERSGFKLPRFRAPILWACVLFGLTMAVTIVWRLPNSKPFPYQAVFWVPGTVAVLLAIYAKPASNGPIDRLFAKLGDASYCTYLFHTFTIAAVAGVFARFRISPTVAILFIISSLVAGNMAGLFIHIVIERRLTTGPLMWLRQAFSVRSTQAEPVASTPNA